MRSLDFSLDIAQASGWFRELDNDAAWNSPWLPQEQMTSAFWGG